MAYNREEFTDICERGLDASPTNELLIEESIIGWKEFEMEVIRDCQDNCIIICSIENFDAMGVHTGDSITVAPAQTLTDKEYQQMRDASIAVLREIGVETGGSNVQFAVNPDNGRLIIVEMNPRVSRSSALASKATGFPIAKIAAKLAIGYTLDELENDITGGAMPAAFEPTIDYIVTKIPRFDFVKFPQAGDELTTQMKSVGEVMAIGSTFQESLQKAIRSLESGFSGLESQLPDGADLESCRDLVSGQLRQPRPMRLWSIADALRLQLSVQEVSRLTGIDSWFIAQIEALVLTEQEIIQTRFANLDAMLLKLWKQQGFSDVRLAELLQVDEDEIRSRRHELNIRPVYKRVDSCSAEFATPTAYMYSTYQQECEADAEPVKKVMILGGGPNRIGQGIEFDYCCVHAAMALKEDGYQTIMVNCNPETVSTDYDTTDRLYFEPLTLEDVLEIIEVEQPSGVIVQYGGQTPLNLARSLQTAGAPIVGTSPDAIHLAEDRERFQALIERLDLTQPPNRTASSAEEALERSESIGYPIIVRPSYVLGGRAMEIVYNSDDLQQYMQAAINVSNASPVLLDRFLNDAIEVDVDAVCDGEQVVVGGIMQHIEEAGVHSGDSACSLPPYSLSPQLQQELHTQTCEMAMAIGVVGLMNVQFAVKGQDVYVLEVNPRASRTVPFVSKATSRPLAKIAARCMLGQSLAMQGITDQVVPSYYSVKEAVFPFIKFPGVDTVLGPEMKSTGEVMGTGRSFGEAFGKAQWAAGVAIPSKGQALISVRKADQQPAVELAHYLSTHGFVLFATQGTADVLRAADIEVSLVNKVTEGRPNVVDKIKNEEIGLIINTTQGKQSLADSYTIRREALNHKITYYTTLAAARAACDAHRSGQEIHINQLQELHQEFA